ncbi:DUF7344 domain-containing protein [Halococcus thailandensis]
MRDLAPTIAAQQPFGVNDEWTATHLERIAVSNGRRRDALQCLGRFVYPVELRTLAAHTVAMRNDFSVDTIETDAIERMAIRLHHLDIPALSAAGLLAYDAESQLVVYTATDVTDQYASRSGSEPRQLSTL